jgi:hypothetical protein
MKSNPAKLYGALADHFNAAAKANPQHSFAFMEELGIYRGALLEGNPLAQEILNLKESAGVEISCRPTEVTTVFRQGFDIYKNAK